jgi:hypothetical protein
VQLSTLTISMNKPLNIIFINVVPVNCQLLDLEEDDEYLRCVRLHFGKQKGTLYHHPITELPPTSCDRRCNDRGFLIVTWLPIEVSNATATAMANLPFSASREPTERNLPWQASLPKIQPIH